MGCGNRHETGVRAIGVADDIGEIDVAVASVPLFYFTPSWRGVFTKDFTYSKRGPTSGKVKRTLLVL